MRIECDKTPECPSVTGHWWDCLRGRAIWRDDKWSDSPRAAAAAERIRALATGDYDEPEEGP